MTRRIAYSVVLLLVLLGTSSTRGQVPEEFHVIRRGVPMVGVQAAFGLNWHTGSVSTAPMPCLCEFRDGTGMGFSVGLRSILPLWPVLFLRPGIAYEQLGGDFRGIRSAYPMLGTRHTVEVVDFRDDLSVTMNVLTLEVLGGWSFVPEGLFVVAGPSVSYVLSATNLHSETILTPGVRFIDGNSRTVLVDTEPRGLRQFLLSLRIGAAAIFDLSQSVAMSPEIMFTFPLQDVTTEQDWRIGGFQASLSIYLRVPG